MLHTSITETGQCNQISLCMHSGCVNVWLAHSNDLRDQCRHLTMVCYDTESAILNMVWLLHYHCQFLFQLIKLNSLTVKIFKLFGLFVFQFCQATCGWDYLLRLLTPQPRQISNIF